MKIENISFRYDDKYIFKDLSLDLPGKLYSITGDSGIGKTTLLKLMGGLLVPESGRITDAPLKPSFMFQEDRLLPWLCHDGDALFLDEPFNGMDDRLIDRCIELIHQEDRFTVISAHQMEVHEKLGSKLIRL